MVFYYFCISFSKEVFPGRTPSLFILDSSVRPPAPNRVKRTDGQRENDFGCMLREQYK